MYVHVSTAPLLPNCCPLLTFLEQVKPLLLVLVEPVLVGHAAEDQAHPANGQRFGSATLSLLVVIVGWVVQSAEYANEKGDEKASANAESAGGYSFVDSCLRDPPGFPWSLQIPSTKRTASRLRPWWLLVYQQQKRREADPWCQGPGGRCILRCRQLSRLGRRIARAEARSLVR